MMKKITIIIVMCIAAVASAVAQNAASGVRVQAQSNLMIVYYDLAEKSDVEAYVSFDNGAKWQGPMRNVTGSTGRGVEAGKDKIIIWDSIEEIGSVEKNASVRVIAQRVSAANRSPDIVAFLERVSPGITPPSAEVEEEPVVVVEPQPVAPPVTQPPPRQTGSGSWVVIIGSFSTRTAAENYARTMEKEGGLSCEVIDAGSQRFRVSAGRFETMGQANQLSNQLKPAFQGQVWITNDN